RMAGEGVVGGRRSGSAALDDDALYEVQGGALALVESSDVEPEGTGAGDRALQLIDRRRQGGDGDHPPPEDGLHTLTGEAFEEVDVDPTSFGDDALGCPARARMPGRQHRRHVEDFATANRLRAPALAQHEPVTRQKWHRDREVHAHEAGAAGLNLRGPGAEQPQPGWLLARTDVGVEGAPAGDGVVEAGEHLQASVENRGGFPLVSTHE